MSNLIQSRRRLEDLCFAEDNGSWCSRLWIQFDTPRARRLKPSRATAVWYGKACRAKKAFGIGLSNGPGRGGVLKKVLYGEAPPRGPTLTLLYTIFFRKGTPFVYLLLEKGTPFFVF